MARREGSATAWGFIFFAGFMMIMIGIFQAIEGLAAIIHKEFYTITPNYIFKFNVTTWGWIHLIIGIVVAIAGFYLFAGKTWARVIGVTMALIAAISNFFFIPIYPIWALVIIAVSVFVIWAICAHGGELRE